MTLSISPEIDRHFEMDKRRMYEDYDYLNMNYDEIFNAVKKYVKTVLKRERSGIGLAIGEFDPKIAAYWQLGTNYLVLNGSLLRTIENTVNNPEIMKDYVMVVVMHEYIHSLGYTDEMTTRHLTYDVFNKVLGSRNEATIMSSKDLWEYFPQFKMARPL
ncbi:MAG: hypothetical protein ACP5UV_03130, partial [Thermoplasmata archaeon]